MNISKLKDELLKKKLSSKELHKYMDEIIKLKFENIDNNKEYTELSHIQEYLNHKINIKNQININLLSFMNILFLPLGIIVGYFGMNFNSMGNVTLNRGILKEINGTQLVIGLTIISFIISYYVYNYHHN